MNIVNISAKTVFLFLIVVFTTAGQGIEVTWGPIIKADSRVQPDKIIGKDASGFYVLKMGHDNVIEKYDNAMHLVFSTKITVQLTKDKRTEFENIHMLHDKIIVFTSFYDNKKNTKALYASHISSSGVIDPAIFQVASFENQLNDRDMYFDISLANDSSRFLIFSNVRERKKRKNGFIIQS